MTAYSFADVNAELSGVGGTVTLSDGGVADEGITVSFLDDAGVMQVGADGNGQHSMTLNRSARITVRIFKENPLNAVLSQMFDAQRSSSAAWGGNTLVVRNPARGDNVTARQVAFIKKPDFVNGKTAGINEWAFNSIYCTEILGDGTPG